MIHTSKQHKIISPLRPSSGSMPVWARPVSRRPRPAAKLLRMQDSLSTLHTLLYWPGIMCLYFLWSMYVYYLRAECIDSWWWKICFCDSLFLQGPNHPGEGPWGYRSKGSSCRKDLAVERTPLRCPHGTQQSRNSRETWRGTGQYQSIH